MADRFVFKSGQLGPILNGGAMRSDLAARAERIAAAARAQGGDVTVTPHQRKDRAGVHVSRSAAAEAQDRALGSAIDAGR